MFRPTLPPRTGYVEIEVNGTRMYKNVKTGISENLEPAKNMVHTNAIVLIETI